MNKKCTTNDKYVMIYLWLYLCTFFWKKTLHTNKLEDYRI